MPLNIQRIDARRGDAQAAIAELRAKLAPSGNIVSEAGRRKTVEVFGKPLAPAEVVLERDVACGHGIDLAAHAGFLLPLTRRDATFPDRGWPPQPGSLYRGNVVTGP